MIRGLKKAEIAIAFGIIVSVVCGAAVSARGIEQARQVSDKLIRLHIIANSDSTEDQQLKLRVRDAVLPVAQRLTQGAENRDQARKMLADGEKLLTSEAERVIRAEGRQYDVGISFETCYFPTKEYGSFALPAGEYEAVRIIIGSGAGKNWWCVMFPPLCVPENEEQAEAIARSAGLDNGEIAFISGDGGEYRIKFKAAELCAQIYHKIKQK